MALVARFGLRQALRSRAALFLGLLLAFAGVATVDGIVAPVEALEPGRAIVRGDPVLAGEVARSPHLVGLVTWATEGDDALMAHLLVARPAILSGILLVLLLLTPFLVAFAAFDQTADDVRTRWMRFVLFRTDRSSVYGGRLVAALARVFALFGLLLLSIALYLDLRYGIYARGALYGWAGAGWLALCALALPYVALCALVSALSSSALRALAASTVAVALPILGLGLLAAGLGPEVWPSALERLHPFGWKVALLHADPGPRAAAFAAMGVFAAAAGGAGALLFARRDL